MAGAAPAHNHNHHLHPHHHNLTILPPPPPLPLPSTSTSYTHQQQHFLQQNFRNSSSLSIPSFTSTSPTSSPSPISPSLSSSSLNNLGASTSSTSLLSYDDLHCLQSKKRKLVELPLFLSKTYTMICEAPSNLAAWSHDGTSFYIIDPKALSEQFIPKYFKHSNFSSFVRQLNIYGFHKIRTHNPSITQDEDLKILEFKHPFFQRDHPELLTDIRRVGSGQGQNSQEYEMMKCQISELTLQVEYLTDTVHELKAILKKTRCDDTLAVPAAAPKLPRSSQRWEALDEDTIDMLMTLDRDGEMDSPDTISEKRGAPYSHNVFKSGNLLSQRGKLETSPPPSRRSLSCSSSFSSSSSTSCSPTPVAVDPLQHRTSVPLNQACALFGTLLTEYYTSFTNFGLKNNTSSSLENDQSPQSTSPFQRKFGEKIGRSHN